MTLEIRHGLPPEQERDAAILYWEAFERKLGALLGPAPRAISFFAETLNHDAVFAAIDGDTLLGIAAVKTGNHGFSTARFSDLLRHYGPTALFRLIPLAMIERRAPDGILQMDGICVSEKARGRGIGRALFAALFDYAKREGYRGVTLDVIDENPRAKALYEKLGFVAIGVEQTSLLRPLLKFRSATKMIKRFD